MKNASAIKSKLDDFNKKLSDIKFDAVPLCNDKEAIDFPTDISSLSSALIDMKQAVDADKTPEYFDALFLDVFDQDHENVSKTSAESLAAKRKYIQWQYSLYQSDIIKTEQTKYEDKEKLFSSAENEKKRITGLKNIYEASLANYQQELIERIEILFHIYSGRIAQESKNSLGLFIKSDNKGIRFLESHIQEHDAVFTMSSGQLAMLIISFTLALNKRFSVNQLLLIDDPVQTLDELNVAGFIELLRNDFSDHQIFVSTHEDSMSTYMRYKFDKFGLKTQRLNFKETQLRITPQESEL